MTALLPTRVSIYDFLFEDTQPIDAIVADVGNISIPQAKILIENCVQAVTSGLIAFNHAEGPEAVIKKLLSRNQVKELRKHNAFNFITMKTAMQYGEAVADVLFPTATIQKNICHRLAQLSSLTSQKVRALLGALTLLCLRELAILADFAHLNANEIEEWLQQQSQFLRLSRDPKSRAADNESCTNDIYKAPPFDTHWLDITRCTLPASTMTNNEAAQMPHYAKVIGRISSANSDKNTVSTNTDLSLLNSNQLIVDKSNSSDVLTFCSIDGITLPYQRWLLQLAKISDIYLSRNRLKIAPEPIQPPSRPLVSFGFIENKPVAHKSPNSFSISANQSNQYLWKNPVIIILVLVISILTLMAVGKYHYKNSKVTERHEQTLYKVVDDLNKSIH